MASSKSPANMWYIVCCCCLQGSVCVTFLRHCRSDTSRLIGEIKQWMPEWGIISRVMVNPAGGDRQRRGCVSAGNGSWETGSKMIKAWNQLRHLGIKLL